MSPVWKRFTVRHSREYIQQLLIRWPYIRTKIEELHSKNVILVGSFFRRSVPAGQPMQPSPQPSHELSLSSHLDQNHGGHPQLAVCRTTFLHMSPHHVSSGTHLLVSTLRAPPRSSTGFLLVSMSVPPAKTAPLSSASSPNSADLSPQQDSLWAVFQIEGPKHTDRTDHAD